MECSILTLAEVASRFPGARKTGGGYMARCPAHADSTASLSLSAGEGGKVLLHCHAGCAYEAVLSAAGLKPEELSPPRDQHGHAHGHRRAAAPPKPAKPPKAEKTYPTARAAVAALERWHGPRSADWTYHSAAGEPVGVIVRWPRPDGGKDILPVSRHADGWRIGGMSEPRPLYALPELAGAKRVYVTEGEKAAEAVRSLGLVATTSPHGAKSAAKADWSTLAGREVILLPDNDAPGERYAADVAALLAKLSPPAKVRVVTLPGLPDGGDAADWVVVGGGITAQDLRDDLVALADAADVLSVEPPEPPLVWQPFPVEALPEPLRAFVRAVAKASGCDSAYVALPLLCAVAAAVGASRVLRLKQGWFAPPILWGALIGESGTLKTPAFKAALKAMRERQQKALREHGERMREHEAALARWERDHAEWKRDKRTSAEPPTKPAEPQAERCLVGDTTVEALAPIFAANPRGLLVARDELAGWLGSFDRYAGGKGADSSHWLSMFGGESLIVDRKTGVPRTIYVPHAYCSIVGGIQPGTLHRALGREHRESGLAARFLLAYPPQKQKRWTESGIDPAAEREIAKLIDRLYDLRPALGEDDQPRPGVVRLSEEAKAAYVAYYTAHAAEQVDLEGDLSAAWSKLEEYAARLALVVHCARWAAGDVDDADVLDGESMAAGIALADWFKHEARRVYAVLGGTEEESEQRKLVSMIERRGGSITARELMHASRQYRGSAAEAEAALHELAKAGLGEWTVAEPGGRPGRVFRLVTAGNGNRSGKNTGENGLLLPLPPADGPESAPWQGFTEQPEADPETANAAFAEAAEQEDWGEA